jgi:hypothetical protein
MSQTVSQQYLDGILEGRALLRAWQAEGLTDVTELARASLTNVDRLCRQYDAQSPVGQLMRGERDFWRNKLKGAK